MPNYSPNGSVVAHPVRVHRMWHSRRWVVIFGLPLLFVSLLWTTLQTTFVARAAAEDVYVGCADGSLLPSYGTIQEAVDNAISGTVINVCPGIYVETVALSDMNGGDEGDLTIRRTPGMTGTVLISTTTFNSSIWIQESYADEDDFHGNLTFESIQTRSTEGYGIDLGVDGGIVVGTVTISNVQAISNAEGGFLVRAVGDIAIINSQANGNGDNGIHIETEAAANVDIINVQANGNGIFAPLDFARSGIWILANPDFDIESCGETRINLENIQANENGTWGIYGYSYYNLVISNTEVISNAFGGIATMALGDDCVPATTTLSNSYAERNGWSTAEKSGEDDYYPYFPNNGGINLISTDGGNIQVDSETVAQGNYNFGYCLANYEFATGVLVQEALASGNLGDGFIFGDACEEYDIESVDSGNVDENAETDVNAAAVIESSIVISNSSGISNSGAGFNILGVRNPMTIANITAEDNTVGVAFEAARLRIDSVGIAAELGAPPVLLYDSLIYNNSLYGVVYEQPVFQPVSYDESLHAAADITSTLFISSNIICENGTGLGAYQMEWDPSSVPGDFEALAEEYLLAIDARGNWWGDASGPTTPDNPGGTGDSIDSEVFTPTVFANAVEVLFEPWIDTIDASAVSSPTLPGIPVALTYQFRDQLADYFLQNGVGDPRNGPLFSLAASNGTIDGDLNKFIVNRSITSSATPGTPGLMTVNLTGPCGLASSINVPVAVPSITIAKSPDVQHALAGDLVSFDIVISNTGDITLTNITVSDPLASACSSATGTLGNIGVGEGVSYNCPHSVADSFTNTINVEAFALLDTGPAGDPVTASDTAQVIVVNPAIAIEKSPDIQGVAPGDTAIFTVTVSNTGDVILTDISVQDGIAPNCSRTVGVLGDLGVAASTSYTCTLVVNNNLVNTINVEGFALLDEGPAATSVTASDTAEVFVASFELSKTVFVDGYRESLGGGNFNASTCALSSNIKVPVNSTVKYCYTITNTGDYTLTTHSLVDSHIPNAILTNFAREVAPGESFSTVDAGVNVTQTLSVSTTNVATWTATLAAAVVEVDTSAVDATLPVSVNAEATVVISGPTDDQDGDNIPDNEEGTGDVDSDGIPDYLDPLTPTALDPNDQPGAFGDGLFLPSVVR